MRVLNDSMGVHQHNEEIYDTVMRWNISIWYIKIPSANDGDIS